MTMYGLYLRDRDGDDFVWFTTVQSLEPGVYRRGRGRAPAPDVYLAESIPALVLQVGPLIDRAEVQAQSSLSSSGTPKEVQERIASRMTEGLLQRLTETSSIWVADPDWVADLRPFTPPGG